MGRNGLIAFLIGCFLFQPTLFRGDDLSKSCPSGACRSSGAHFPRVIYAPDPEYPERALKDRRKGNIMIGMVVGADGLPRDLEVMRSLAPELDRAAINAVKRWKFVPGDKNGEPVAMKITVELTP